MTNEAGFESFWRAYPRRVGKGAAKKVWGRLNVSAQLQDAMMQALTWQCQRLQWQRDGGQFIPHPATWLRQERWLDEPQGGVRPSHVPRSVAVVDPDYQGAAYRFHCGHTPTCSSWPQHRDLLNADEAVSA